MATEPTQAPPSPLGLTRDAAHRYTWCDGRTTHGPLPSVTTVLGVLDRSGPLVGWAKRETAACAVRNLDVLAEMCRAGGDQSAIDWLKKIPDHQRDVSANMGTRVHSLAERMSRGEEPEATPEEAPFVAAYRSFLTTYEPRFLAIEEMVVSLRHGYAGTFDSIALIDGEVWMLDIKTGTGIYAEAGLQLAAYNAADFIGRPGTAIRFRLPRATRFGVVHVRPEGARLIEYRVGPDTVAAFLDARRLFGWTQGAGKAVIGTQVPRGNPREAA
jgi:hypothetical protein